MLVSLAKVTYQGAATTLFIEIESDRNIYFLRLGR